MILTRQQRSSACVFLGSIRNTEKTFMMERKWKKDNKPATQKLAMVQVLPPHIPSESVSK